MPASAVIGREEELGGHRPAGRRTASDSRRAGPRRAGRRARRPRERIAGLNVALACGATGTFPFERARTLLVLGAAHRQARRRSAARASLEEALVDFDALGAAPWVARTRDELCRVSGRRGQRTELTDSEQRVAVLAAEGLRNKEIAARLFIEVGTVEVHLTRIYRKLGVRSRTELAARVASRAEPSLGSSRPNTT